jgi:hypothetical protein
VLYGAAALSRSDRWKKGCTAPPLGTITARARKTDHKEEDDVGQGPNKGMPKRGSAFEKLQSEREAKGVEEDLARDVEERQEREQIRQEEQEEGKQIRQEQREEREQIRQEEREERKREREKARGQEESS